MITKLLGFSAEAEVLGRAHEVAFHAGTLTIQGLSLAEAYAVLAALSHGKLSPAEMPVPVIPTEKAEKALARPQDEKLNRAKTLGEVINCLIDQGFTKVDDLVSQCLGLREAGHVLLGRVANLEQRVRDTAALLMKAAS